MKELSIEENAKAYTELINRLEDVKDAIKKQNYGTAMDILYKPYPQFQVITHSELKESGDERIRKELIAMVKLSCTNGNDVDKKIAWIEKQGEQNIAEISNVCEFSIETWIKIVDYVLTEHNGIGNYLIDPEVKDTAEKLQKRYKFDAASEEWDRVYRKGLDAGVNKGRAEALREQKPMDKIQLGKKYKCIASPRYSTFMKGLIYKPEDEFLCSLMNFSSDCFEPMEDNDQKPTDTVEPKFKVGDWIVNNEHNNVAKVLEVNEQYYILDYCDTIGTVAVELIDNDYHLWTIQDAKAGDVLVTKNKNIFIFESINGYTIYDYCGWYFEKFANSSGTVNGKAAKQLPTDYVPATKEQRDLLFSKMKESGYDWDAEKKELKKVEQLPIDVRTTGYWHVEDVEQKPVWSEEDEEMYKRVETAIDSYYAPFSRNAEEMSEWFKSFKERYTWKPSDEQMHYLSWIANIKLGDSVVEQEVSKRLNELLEDLKKLKG